GDDGDLLPQLGQLADFLRDEVSIVGPEAEEDADVGILADRRLDIDLGSAGVRAVLEDLGLLEGSARAGEEALATLDGVGRRRRRSSPSRRHSTSRRSHW